MYESDKRAHKWAKVIQKLHCIFLVWRKQQQQYGECRWCWRWLSWQGCHHRQDAVDVGEIPMVMWNGEVGVSRMSCNWKV